jgi:hypothetical protein
MIRLTAAAAAIFVAASQSFAQSMPNYDIASYCHGLAGGSYSLESTCRKSEQNDKEVVQRATVSPEIWRYCANLVGSSESYSLLRSCIRSEESAKSSLGQSKSPTIISVPNAPRKAATGAPATRLQDAVQPADVQPADVQPANIQPTNIQPANIQPANIQPAKQRMNFWLP